MKKQIVFPIVVAWTLGTLTVAPCQDYTTQAPAEYGVPQKSVGHQAEPPGHLSDWVLYRRAYDCCGPVGGQGPIMTELYMRTGVSIPFGGGVYNDVLDPGLVVQGGARLMFYEKDMRSAWFLDASISNVFNPEDPDSDVQVPLSVLVPGAFNPFTNQTQVQRVNFGSGGIPGVTVENLNRTYVNFGGGYLWHLVHPEDCNGLLWRVGWDGGGRYGSGRGRFQELQARTDTIYGLYAGAQGDVEIPCGCAVFLAGLRAEYSYTWMDILQQNDADVQELNVLVHFGVRY